MIVELFKSSRLIAVNNILFQTDFNGRKTGSVQSLEFLKKSWNLPSNFLDLEKVWKIEIKSGKMVKNFLEGTKSALQVNFFFLLVKSYSISRVRLRRIIDKALFLLFFLRSLLLTYFDNWESGKSLEKIVNFGSKNLLKPWKERLSYNCHYLSLTPFTYPA